MGDKMADWIKTWRRNRMKYYFALSILLASLLIVINLVFLQSIR
jgi:hypothetical protein